MSAYVILFRESPIHDEDSWKAYRTGAGGSPKMKPLVVYGDITSIEGTPPDGVILLEFPSVQDAKDWYYSEEYQAKVGFRLGAADYRGVIVEGFDPSTMSPR